MSVWSKIMSLFRTKVVQPHILPLAGLTDKDHDLDCQLINALEKHKVASDWVIKRSLDAVDRSEEARAALRSVMERMEVPSLRTAKEAFDLVSRGQNEHHS